MSSDSAQPADTRGKRLMIALAVLGLALIVMPAAFQMFTKAPKGAGMIDQFKPFMTNARLDGYQADLRQINAAVTETNTAVAARFAAVNQEKPGSGTDVPTYTSFASQWPGIDSDMTGLMDKVQGNLGNYQAVAALPSFKLFPWFFVIPGVIVLGLSGLALARPRYWRKAAWALAVVGIGLVAAPGVFQMFTRAPDGGRMMSAFKSIETTDNVEQIQGYFSSMAVGQGAIRLQIVPALEATGLTSTEVDANFPAVAALDANWVHILNDMTPMIGAMADNVTAYQAVASLPPFPLFPYFFVLPGLILAGLAGAAIRARRNLPALQPAPVPTSRPVATEGAR